MIYKYGGSGAKMMCVMMRSKREACSANIYL